MGEKYIDLYELQTMLKKGIENIFPGKLWVKAEISALKARPAGHCYMELSQSSDEGLVAKVQAVIWSSKFRFLAPFFKSVTGSDLAEGMNVLVCVSVNFSQLYGLSLVIDDIDPSFTVGEKEMLRRMTIERLEKEGLTDRQKELALPVLPYSLAVISAPDAAGYRDFTKHLCGNGYGFVFRTELFPAVMQGSAAPASIAEALERIAGSGCGYDLVLIMRGGGAKLDLACYDDYGLAAAIAMCPVPVFTAVGHDQDYHVCDMVAYHHLKTPTALADELIGYYADEDARLLSFGSRLKLAFLNKINAMESRIQLLETRIRTADPRNILQRGYVLALDSAGVPFKRAAGRSPGERVSLMLADGRIDCTVDRVVPGDGRQAAGGQ